MTKLRSLMYREMRISRKTDIIKVLLFIGFVGMLWAALITILSDSSIQDSDFSIDSFIDFWIIYTSCIGSLVGLSMDEVFKSDVNVGWLRYSYALPVTPFERALVRVVRMCIMTAVGMVAATLNIIGFCAYADVDFSIDYITLQFIFLDIMLVTTIITELFVLAARNPEEIKKYSEHAGWTDFLLMIISIVVFFKANGLSVKDFSDDNFMESFDIFEKLTGGMLLWLIPLTLLLIALHFAVVYHRFRFAYGATVKVKQKNAEKVAAVSNAHSQPVGFLYKEIRQNMRIIILVAALPLCLLLFGFFMGSSMHFFDANSDFAGVFDLMTNTIAILVMIGTGYFIASTLLTSVFQGDDKKLWAYFTVSTPTGVRGFMYYKYVLCFAMNGLYLVGWIFAHNLVSTIRYAVTGKEADSMNGVILAVFFALLFACAIDIPFIIRFGAKKGNTIKLWAMMSLFTVAVVGFSLLPESISDKIMELLVNIYKGQANDTLMLIVSFCPLIALAGYIHSYKVSCRLFMKGVNEYDK